MSGLLLPCTLTDEKGGRIVPARGKVFLGSSRNLGGSSLGALLRKRKVTGRDASLPAPLLVASLGLVERGTVGALPQTPQGTLSLDPARGRRKGTKSPLDPFSRLSWSRFHAPSACSFLALRLSPCLLPPTFREEPFFCRHQKSSAILPRFSSRESDSAALFFGRCRAFSHIGSVIISSGSCSVNIQSGKNHRISSYIMMAAAIAAFRLSAPPRMGRRTRCVAVCCTCSLTPLPSLPMTRANCSATPCRS